MTPTALAVQAMLEGRQADTGRRRNRELMAQLDRGRDTPHTPG